MESRQFKLQIAQPVAGVRYAALSMHNYIDGCYGDPIVREIFGEQLDFSRLFAYCVLRFGYECQGYERLPELGRYRLTTPNPRMLLTVSPDVNCDDSQAQFCFIVDAAAHEAFEKYAFRDIEAWQQKAVEAWLMREMPQWMPEWCKFCDTELKAVYSNVKKHKHWMDTVRWMKAGPVGEPDSELYNQTSRAYEFYQHMLDEYEKVASRPARQVRGADWRNWDEEDPLKAFAQGAHVALTDLLRPVNMEGRPFSLLGSSEVPPTRESFEVGEGLKTLRALDEVLELSRDSLNGFENEEERIFA